MERNVSATLLLKYQKKIPFFLFHFLSPLSPSLSPSPPLLSPLCLPPPFPCPFPFFFSLSFPFPFPCLFYLVSSSLPFSHPAELRGCFNVRVWSLFKEQWEFRLQTCKVTQQHLQSPKYFSHFWGRKANGRNNFHIMKSL